ncbi:MAG: M23 family metallopeptidase [Hyphomicrobium sp.]|nr:M23 family metallopeptidase [Hyphomicrobium sp.]
MHNLHVHSMRARGRQARRHDPSRPVPHLYRGSRGMRARADVYATDHADMRGSGRLRWLMSTCLAAAVGAVAIIVVIYGSADPRDGADGLMPALARLSGGGPDNFRPMPEPQRPNDGLRWAIAKTDKLAMNSGAMSTRYIIHETLKQRRNGREYIYAKPYVRIVSRLAPVPPNYADVIPPFNPLKLYGDSNPVGSSEEGSNITQRNDVDVRVVELLGGFLPEEDGQELEAAEVDELVARAEAAEQAEGSAGNPQDQLVAPGDLKPITSTENTENDGPNSTILAKSTLDSDHTAEDIEDRQVRTVKVGPKDTLSKILAAAGAEPWLVTEMLESAKPIFEESALAAGQDVEITVVPSLTDPNDLEPVRFTVLGEGGQHIVTVGRSAAGEFVASATPSENDTALRLASVDSDRGTSSSLYAALYHAGVIESVPTETIQQILKTHAYETDFRRRIRSSDTVEYFFDLKNESAVDGPPGELLFTAISSAGEQSRYYRFRTPDGTVDFYDLDGNNSRKFLMRKPIRGEDLRLTSGYGVRYHPLLGVRKMHTGVDWAAPPGTPILAAGNGVIEEAGRKSAYGNYVRIRHANGYQTAYGHMQRLANGVAAGVKVKQGQVIGYVGSTGLSSGPHLHYEVLVNTRFVDPLSIQVPRERKLTGKELAEFQKERSRIDELMRRPAVMTANK